MTYKYIIPIGGKQGASTTCYCVNLGGTTFPTLYCDSSENPAKLTTPSAGTGELAAYHRCMKVAPSSNYDMNKKGDDVANGNGHYCPHCFLVDTTEQQVSL